MTTFDPWTATFEDAQAAHGGDDGPCGPLHQWAAVQELLAGREQIEAGDGFDALQAVALCAMRGLVMPDWLVTVFLRRYRRVQRLHADSWDDESAFGRPYPKHAQLPALRRRRDGRIKASLAFSDRLQRDPMRAVDKALWEDIGREIGEGATRAEELYREALRMGIGSTAADMRKRAGCTTRPTTLRKLAGIRRRR